jgi:hypothetical protein
MSTYALINLTRFVQNSIRNLGHQDMAASTSQLLRLRLSHSSKAGSWIYYYSKVCYQSKFLQLLIKGVTEEINKDTRSFVLYNTSPNLPGHSVPFGHATEHFDVAS